MSPYTSWLLHWHWGNLTIASAPVKQSWRIWIKLPGQNANTPKQNETPNNQTLLAMPWPLFARNWMSLSQDGASMQGANVAQPNLRLLISRLNIFKILQNYQTNSLESHHIWHVAPYLSYGDTSNMNGIFLNRSGLLWFWKKTHTKISSVTVLLIRVWVTPTPRD